MAQTSSIEWTDATWNPVTGCTKISPGCDHCYAEAFAERFRGVAGHAYEVGFDLTLRPERIDQPLRWKQPRMIFVNSMSDLFQKEIAWSFIDRVFETMTSAHWHTFQVLTKRSSILRDYINSRFATTRVPDHIWLGVSVENRQSCSRIEHLRQARASVRFVSAEPLLECLGEVNLDGIHWLIAGGESGRGARPMNPEWVRHLRDICGNAGVAFFFKQWGAHDAEGRRGSKHSNGRILDGRAWDEMPTAQPVAQAGLIDGPI
jgi:protein gp37